MSYPEFDVLEVQCKDLTALVGELAPEDFERPTRCTGWNVRDMCAHVAYAAERTRTLAESDAGGRTPNTDRARWWTMPDRTDPAVISKAATDGGAALDPAAATALVESAVSSMLARFSEIEPDAIVGNEWRTLPARELVGSRVLEFGVHTMDIGHATLRGERIHADAALFVADILQTLLAVPLPAGLGWDPRTFILTGMGRRRLLSNERFVLGPLSDRFPLVR